MADHKTNFRCEEIVIGGDLNLTLNVELDKEGGGTTSHTSSLAVVKNIQDNLELGDIKGET